MKKLFYIQQSGGGTWRRRGSPESVVSPIQPSPADTGGNRSNPEKRV